MGIANNAVIKAIKTCITNVTLKTLFISLLICVAIDTAKKRLDALSIIVLIIETNEMIPPTKEKSPKSCTPKAFKANLVVINPHIETIPNRT